MGKKLFIALALSFFAAGPAQANLLVDTGQPTNTTGGIGLSYPQILVAQFTLNQNATITAVRGWINAGATGGINVQIYQDNGDVPGMMVNSQMVEVSTTGAAWIGASSLNWTLSAGKYWVGFMDTMNSIQGSMPKPAPLPLAKEGSRYPWGDFVRQDDMDIGVRISGYAAGSTPPVNLLLLGD